MKELLAEALFHVENLCSCLLVLLFIFMIFCYSAGSSDGFFCVENLFLVVNTLNVRFNWNMYGIKLTLEVFL